MNLKKHVACSQGSMFPQTSIFQGVSFNRRMGMWESYVVPNKRSNGKRHIGFHTNEIEAAVVRDKFLRANFPGRALYNFPQFGEGESAVCMEEGEH